jgi:hypothetical protein
MHSLCEYRSFSTCTHSPAKSYQPNPTTEASSFEVWSRLIPTYGRFKNLFILRAEDAGIKDGPWAEILINPRINREEINLRAIHNAHSGEQVD